MKASVSSFFFAAIAVLTMHGCIADYERMSPHPPYEKTIRAHGTFALERTLSYTDKPLGNKSAFHPLPDPIDALAARVYLIDHAQKSLDLQYYIYEDDTIGKVLSAHLLKAADRGVRVRLLIDDMNAAHKEKILASLAAHPNISLRIFNPNRFRTFFRNLGLILDLDRLGKRMHNKALVADGYAAIVGGRNIAESYFAQSDETHFFDYDILCIGSIVGKISHAFDLYYNSAPAVPLERLLPDKTDNADVQHTENALRRFRTPTQIRKEIARSAFMRDILHKRLLFYVADKCDLFYDLPQKVWHGTSQSRYRLTPALLKHLGEIRHKLILISPYFVPSEQLLSRFKALRKKGVEIVVITNSLSATDVFAVYSGYKNRIVSLKKIGVKLYEVKRNDIDTLIRKGIRLAHRSSASLHTKMMIFDDDRLVVGSANLDPRSHKLNTEMLLLIRSKKLTTMHKAFLEKSLRPELYYIVSLEHYKNRFGHTVERIVWETVENGKRVRYTSEPDTPIWKHFLTDLLTLLPIEGYL